MLVSLSALSSPQPLSGRVAAQALVTGLTREAVRIGPLALPGEAVRVPDMVGMVLFAHHGSRRNNSLDLHVAQVLQHHHLGTLLFDLLTDAEADDARNVFNVALMGERVRQALDWTQQVADLARQPCGLFGDGTAAAAALVVAAARPGCVAGVVSCGGRPDLAAHCLARVQAPTLLMAGASDRAVLDLNRAALRALCCQKRLEVVPGRSDLFEELGARGSVAELAAQWLHVHLSRPRFA